MAISTEARNDIVRIVVGMFNGAPGSTILSQLTNAFEAGQTRAQIATNLAKTAEYQSLYPDNNTNGEVATKLVNSLLGNLATAAVKAEAVTLLTGMLNAKNTSTPALKAAARAEVTLWALDALKNVPASDAALGAAVTALNNKVEVASYYSVDAQQNPASLAAAQDVVKDVTNTAASVTAAKGSIDGTVTAGQTFSLTASLDNVTGNLFSSRPEYTPGGNDLVNTLQDGDILTGTGVNPTLNVTLGSVNDAGTTFINPVLNNIQTINVAVTSGDIEGLGLEESTGTKAINVTRISQNQTSLLIDNIAESANSLSVSNATRGAAVEFNFRDDAGVSLEDELNVGLSNVRLTNLAITRTGSLTDQHDTVNLTTSGPVTEVTTFGVFGDNDSATDQTLNLTADAVSSTFTNFNAGSVTAMNLVANGATELTALNAGALKALTIEANSATKISGQTTGALRTITVTGTENVDLLDVKGDTASGVAVDSTGLEATGRLSANLSAVSNSSKTVVNTGAGNDVLTSTAAMAGTINAGAGNNTITTTSNFGSTARISAGDGNNTVSGLQMQAVGDDIGQLKSTNAVDSAARITLGNGNNTVTVTDMQSAASWNNWDTLDANVDDTFMLVGSHILAGDGNNTISVRTMAENAVINLGDGKNSITFSGFGSTGATVLAADTTNERERINLSSSSADADTLGAQIYLGDGGNTVTFNDTTLEATADNNIDSLLFGEGALLRAGDGVDTLKVNFINDVQVTANATELLNNTLIEGVENISLTAQKAGLDANNALKTNTASVSLDVLRVDQALESINLVSLEDVTLVNSGLGSGQESESYVAGNATYFTLRNHREGVAVNLSAKEASGVENGALKDDSIADVYLAVDMADAQGDDDTFTLNIANSGAFDLDITMNPSSFPLGEDRDAENTYEVENVVINLNTNSHTFYFNDFGDGYQNNTSVLITGTAADKEIVLHHINANEISVLGAGNVTLDTTVAKDGSDYESVKLLKITTGSGNDHITASALSLRNVDGSSVDVGTGTNRLSLDWGTGVTLTPGLLEEYFEARYPVSQTRDTGSDSTASMAEFIAGNTGKTVPTVTVGSRINGTLNNDDDLDTYAVFLEAGKTYQLSFFSGEENGYSGIDLDFFAYDSQKNAITTTPFEDEDKDSTGVDNGEQRIFTPTTSGIYYFEVGPHGDDTGVYGFEVEELGTDSQVLDFTDIDFSGNLHQLDILNDVALFPGTTSNLNMPGGTDNVSILTFTDLVVGEDEGTGANLNIKGASNDFTILSDGDFTLGEATGNAEVIEGLGTLSVMNAAGVEITGALHVEAESDVAFRVGNNALESLSVSAIDNDAVIRVGGNTSESFTINAINIDAGGDAYVFIDNNDSSKLSLGAVSITSEDDVDLNIWENKNTDITFSSINVEADEDGSIYLSYNELYDSDDDLTTNDMKIVVSGPIDLYADGDAYFEIGYNYESSVDRDLIIDIQSSVSVTSEDEKSIVYVGRNDDVTLNFKGMFEVSTNSQFGDYAWMDVSYNNNSTIRFEDTVTVSATGEDSDVYFYIQDNDNGSVRFNASVLIDSDDYAEFRIQDNVSASVRLLGGVNIEAGSDIDIDILYNDDQLTPTAASVLINGITAKSLDSGDVELYIYDNDYAVVRTGNVSLTSLGFDSSTVSLEIISNDDSEITLGSVDMSGNYVHLDIYGNDSSAVSLDDVMMIANDSDVYFYVHSAGEDSISIKDVTARAYDDIWFYAANQSGNDSEVRLGNINLRAGAELAEGDTFTNSASWDADVYLYLDTVEGTETIHLQTNAGEDSDIDAYINNTPDLHTVTLVGAGANETSWLQIYGEQGNDAGVFTIDLSGLNSSAWVRTVTNDINNFRDNVDMFADFDTGTVVKVLIGASSTVEYNVESVGTSYLFSGSSSGYVSTGVRDLTPVIEVLRINGFEGTQSNHVNYSSWNSTDSITVNFGGAAYVFTNQFGEGTWSVSGPNGVDTFAEFADAIGATYVGIIDSQLSIEGAYDGSDIPAITSIFKEATIVYYVYDDEDFGGGYDQFVTSNTSIPSYSVTLEGVMVTDGKGLVDREVFTFTGNDVGSVVIGGFNPGAWNTVSPINGQVTDRLDFSQFSKVSSLDDMIFTIENTGPFANVVIDFVDTDLGSVTLVGVGQYADAIALVQGSIMFS